MELREFFSEDAVKLDLVGTTKDDILKELIGLLKLDEKSEGMLFKMLKRRENLGSTGIGRGIAIPHCRSLVVNKLRVAFGRKKGGVDFKAIDEKPVNFFFLIVAPPLEVSNQYLPVLGKIAQFSKEPDVPQRLMEITEPRQFIQLLEEKGGLKGEFREREPIRTSDPLTPPKNARRKTSPNKIKKKKKKKAKPPRHPQKSKKQHTPESPKKNKKKKNPPPPTKKRSKAKKMNAWRWMAK